MFIHYLQELNLWKDDQLNYAFGTPERAYKKEPAETGSQAAPQVLSTDQKTHRINIVTKSGYLWDTRQKEAIEKGNLVHDIMAQIRTREDIDFAINNLLNHGIMDSHQAELLKTQITTVVNHPKLSSYFEPNLTIYNERDIITEQNTVFRPDRLVINSNNEAVIIDYKTGAENTTHRQQLQLYQDVIEQMHYKVIKKFLVYFNAEPLILEA
nr:PD-(D/E)XK nuclease family protein [Aestuariivivens sediminicola]